jgi:hypothetical protein
LVTLLSRSVNLLIAAVNGFDPSARGFNTLLINGFCSLKYSGSWSEKTTMS